MQWKWITWLLGILPNAGKIITFLTPEKWGLLLAAVQATIAYKKALDTPDPKDDFVAAETFLISTSDFASAMLGADQKTREVIEKNLVPFLLEVIYGDGDKA